MMITSTNFPQRSGQVISGINTTTSKQGLSEREMEILREIGRKTGSQVQLNLGNKCEETGWTLAVKGFWGISADDTERRPFLVTPAMLREMATDEGKFNQWMNWVSESVQRQVELENQLRASAEKIDEGEAERKAFRIKVNMMAVLDFWNDNREDASWTRPAQEQMLQGVAEQYTQLLSGTSL